MQHQTWHISNIGPLGSNGCVQKLNKLKNGILWFHHKITGRRNVMHFSFPKNYKSFPKFPYFWNLLKRLIFAVFRSSNMFLLIFFYLFITFHINILIDYFFHIACFFFHCTMNRWDGWGVVESHQGVGGGTGGGFYIIVSCLFVLLSIGVSCPVSF